MKPFIVVADGFDKQLFQELSSNGNLEVHPKSKLTLAELEPLLPKIDGLVVRSNTQVNASLLSKATQLKYVIRAGEGIDNIDLPRCKKQNVKVANTPGANSNSAAEHAIALMFTVLRKTAWAHQSMMGGEWEKSAFLGNELSDKNIGIVGFGRIGQTVARRLQGFDPNIMYYDPKVTKTDIPKARKVSNLEEVFNSSDIISLHMPYIEATHHMVNKKLFDLMLPHSILVNASRGNIVNEDDLYLALAENKIRGAGFDVFANEPLNKDSKLRSLKNIVLTPHLGASTEEAQFRVGLMVNRQIKEFFIHNNLQNEVLI